MGIFVFVGYFRRLTFSILFLTCMLLKKAEKCVVYSVLNGIVLCVYPQSSHVEGIKQWWSGERER